MRRLFILLLALLLPLQFTWAAAAVYCGHEGAEVVAHAASPAVVANAAVPAVRANADVPPLLANAAVPAHHFGHHEHVHQANQAEAKKDAAKPLSIDTDCGVCHAGGSPVIGASLQLEALRPLSATLAATPAAALASAFARAPDRPQWPVLA